MMRAALAAAAVLLLPPVDTHAQVTNADLSLRFSASSTLAHPAQFLSWSVTAVNDGPAHTENVVVTIDIPGEFVAALPSDLTCTGQRPIRCTMPLLPPHSTGSGGVVITTKAPVAAGAYTATASIAGSSPDPNPANNSAAVPFTVSDAPDVSVSIARGAERIVPGETRNVGVFVGTGSGVVHDVRVTLQVTGGATIAAITPPAGFSCSGLLCTAPAFGPQGASIGVSLVAPDRDDGGTLGVEADVSSSDLDFDPRNNHASAALTLVGQFAVTTTADSGPGSLRQAIHDADVFGAGAPARIVFRIPAPATIHPRSPLPPLGGAVSLEGKEGIEIRGDLQPEGDGISIDSACEVRVQGMTINGFPRNGINIGSSRLCGGQFPPVVISGNVIGFNERGIGGSDADTVWINDNVIGNNRRSAIFLFGGRVADIAGNFIGLTRDGAPAPNGASGIYVSLFSANIAGNVIANNTDFGIAVSARSPAIGMRRNRIFGNGHTAIDVGLDLESPNGDDRNRAMLNHPVLVEAHYDAAADQTIVRGRYDTGRNNGTVVLEFFASAALNGRGHAEAERFLGELKIFTSRDFELAAPGNLIGQWIAATATMEDSLTIVRDVTSELSDAVQVSP